MSEKSRKTAFAVIASVMAVFTVLVTGIFCDLVSFPVIEPNTTDIIYVDGTDFSGLAELGTAVTDLIIRTAAAAITVIAVLIVTFAAWGIFRVVVFKNNSAADKNELIFSRRVFLISSAAPFVVTLVYSIACAVQTGSGEPFWSLLLCLPDPLFMWLFYMMKLRKSAA